MFNIDASVFDLLCGNASNRVQSLSDGTWFGLRQRSGCWLSEEQIALCTLIEIFYESLVFELFFLHTTVGAFRKTMRLFWIFLICCAEIQLCSKRIF
jgi:hypothetical protein